ncbi:class I SAM-dependent methyltransferase [Amycolatopsis sp. FBCC-B4732]|uniref:class I SAM-dependent methyltransferase n=1 Tax=Amycolatopsis sp. FBCC-B4732 TaxID=3079339 RepID=UPI001FF4FDF4|nr:class I SAM-dependent methyltransferase [Amycolatopsis sp. FBCC-B4732]UOX89999.1 class I SAM-dependent methyltransferase [Amycolatopsis sp. FBCC-B4732]
MTAQFESIRTLQDRVPEQEKDQIREIYDDIAAEYDRRIPGEGPTDHIFTESESEFLLSKTHAGDEVLDLGCGTGRFTIPLAESGAVVTGLDLSPGMLAVARAKLGERGLRADLREGDMADLPFPDACFDVVTSMLALMHIPIPDRPRVFREVHRVLKPGGRMVLCVKNAVFERMFTGDRFASVDITDVQDKKLIFTGTGNGTEHTASWYSFAPHDLAALFAGAGMAVTHLKGNSPVSAWLADEVLADVRVRGFVRTLERALSDVPPFNHLGYYLLAEAVKPVA